jgi:hypothetical protein
MTSSISRSAPRSSRRGREPRRGRRALDDKTEAVIRGLESQHNEARRSLRRRRDRARSALRLLHWADKCRLNFTEARYLARRHDTPSERKGALDERSLRSSGRRLPLPMQTGVRRVRQGNTLRRARMMRTGENMAEMFASLCLARGRTIFACSSPDRADTMHGWALLR